MKCAFGVQLLLFGGFIGKRSVRLCSAWFALLMTEGRWIEQPTAEAEEAAVPAANTITATQPLTE